MDRFLQMIGGEDALPPKTTSTSPSDDTSDEASSTRAKQADPPFHHTQYDSQEYQLLPKPNPTFESALPQVKQSPDITNPISDPPRAFSISGNAAWDPRKGALLPANTELSPFVAITKYCYKYVPKQWSQPLATAFFDSNKIYTRDWSL
jgi:hypothetical protein